MLKIDTHAHILPESWPNLAEKYRDDRFPVVINTEGRHRIYKDGKFFREIWANAFDPEVRIAEYARFGVDVQVVSTVPVMFSYWAKPSQALELHRFLNDHMAEVCRRYPRNYAGIGTVPSVRGYFFRLARASATISTYRRARRSISPRFPVARASLVTRAEPIPSVTAPQAIHSAAVFRSTPPVGESFRCGMGASRSLR